MACQKHRGDTKLTKVWWSLRLPPSPGILTLRFVHNEFLEIHQLHVKISLSVLVSWTFPCWVSAPVSYGCSIYLLCLERICCFSWLWPSPSEKQGEEFIYFGSCFRTLVHGCLSPCVWLLGDRSIWWRRAAHLAAGRKQQRQEKTMMRHFRGSASSI